MFTKILIANRGEIACRVIKTCKRMGIRTVAVFSDVDTHAQHVKLADEAYLIGGPRPIDSYLKGEVILEIAKQSGAQAIHPGYGFLSENASFAAACEKSAMVFVGPSPGAIEKMGSKSHAKALMQAANVPVVPGYHGGNQEPAFLANESKKIGFPQLIKAVAGGGGKGMRLVEKPEEFATQLDAARREARNAFGNDDVLIERYVLGPHHIEFQVFGDSHGNVVHLYERECSIQRRHQKILEETPSPFLELIDDGLREKMGAAAVAAARAIAYRGAGTIEFIVGEDRQFFFMEMNTRLQVEHPITEMITGEDLVEWQLRVAAGEPLPLTQPQIITGGHAIEVRICAENPANDFLPETGKLHLFATPIIETGDDVRLDTGVVSGDEISVYYDPMIAKLITWGADRSEATRRMQHALSQTAVLGIKTNLAFLQQVVRHPAFLAGDTDTGFIPAHRAALFHDASHLPDRALIAASLSLLAAEANIQGGTVWDAKDGWWLNRGAHRAMEFHTINDVEIVTVDIETVSTIRHVRIANRTYAVTAADHRQSAVSFVANGHAETALVFSHGNTIAILFAESRYQVQLVEPFRFEGDVERNDGRLTAMMPGRVVKVMVQAGDAVKKGQALIIMEAMKMEHTVVSPSEGIVARVAFRENDLVPADAVLFVFDE